MQNDYLTTKYTYKQNVVNECTVFNTIELRIFNIELYYKNIKIQMINVNITHKIELTKFIHKNTFIFNY